MSRVLPKPQWQELAEQLFAAGGSIGFISHLLRLETFAQGYHGERSDPEQRLVSPETFEKIRDVMLARYAEAGLAKLLETRQAITILYAWSQAGGRAELVDEISKAAQDDDQFLAIMRNISTVSVGNETVSFSLSVDAIGNFFDDPPAIVRRVMELAKLEPPVAEAHTVLGAIEADAEFNSGTVDDAIAAWTRRQNLRHELEGKE